jgi:hypothetical protein
VTIDGITVLAINDLIAADSRAQVLLERYADDTDRLRWCLKSILIGYLLKQGTAESVIYSDSDTCYFRSPLELIELLGTGSILLTPHWRPLDPRGSTRKFRLNFLDGLFNAGCIVARSEGIDAIEWWATACLSACERKYEDGLYDDQRYLDLLPIYFAGTVVCRHRGYNLADWNVHLREYDGKGMRAVPDTWPVSMVHFTPNTVKRIREGRDPVLVPYLAAYSEIDSKAKKALGEYPYAVDGHCVPHKLEAPRLPDAGR